MATAITTSLYEWDDSLVVRIPPSIAQKMSLRKGDALRLIIMEDSDALQPETPTLEQLLEGVTPQNLHAETDCGAPMGKEHW